MRHETIDRWLDRAAFIGVGIVICILALVAFPVVVAGDVRLDVASPPAASTVKVLAGQGHGSGVSIGGGYIITAAHVTIGEDDISVLDDTGRKRPAEVMWQSQTYDVAMLRVDDDALASSQLACRVPTVGEHIHVVGNPVMLDWITTWGRVSGTVRQIGDWRVAVPLDVTIAPGNSGGPVFDARGNVVGIAVGMMAIRGAPIPESVMVPGRAICDLMARP